MNKRSSARMRARVVSPRSGAFVFVFVFALVACAGCATTTSTPVPRELATARQSYFRTAAGPSPAVNAERLARAKYALDVAERAFRERPNSPVTRDLAYIAARDAELVDAETGTILAALRMQHALSLIRRDGEPSTGGETE